MKILCKKRTFSAAGIVLPLIVLALTGCPNKPGGGGGQRSGKPAAGDRKLQCCKRNLNRRQCNVYDEADSRCNKSEFGSGSRLRR